LIVWYLLFVKKYKYPEPKSPEMLYFYLKMHQNAFGGWALPEPAGGAYSTPHTP